MLSSLQNFSFGEERPSSREVKRKGSIASGPRPILQQLKVVKDRQRTQKKCLTDYDVTKKISQWEAIIDQW